METELPTDGPFARLAKPQEPSASVPSTRTAEASDEAPGRNSIDASPGRNAIETHNLEFSYPGIGIPPSLENSLKVCGMWKNLHFYISQHLHNHASIRPDEFMLISDIGKNQKDCLRYLKGPWE